MCKEPKHDFSELCWIKSVLFALKFHKYMFKISCFIETADILPTTIAVSFF